MICSWSDEEEEDDDEDTSSDEEDRKLCLMAKGDEDEDDQVTSPFEDYSNSDWKEAYFELLDKYEHFKRDNRHYKKKINSIVHDNTLNDKNTFQEAQIVELKNSLIEHEKDKDVISNLKVEKENLFTVIDEQKIRMQKYQEETNITNEKVVAIKSVNSELQSTVEKFQKKSKKNRKA